MADTPANLMECLRNMNVTILNGPPGCGKDTLAKILCERHPALHKEFKEFLYAEVARWIRTTTENVRKRNEDRSKKELPWILGRSVREWCIHVSERIIKPRHGEGYFGKKAANDWWGYHAPIITSDGGFPDETIPVCTKFGAENVMVIQLHREGYDFSNDSRRYISEHHVPCNVFHVQLVDGDIESAVTQIQALRKEFFK